MGYFSSPAIGGSGYTPPQPTRSYFPTDPISSESDKPYGVAEFVQRPDLNQAYRSITGQAASSSANLLSAAGHAPGYIAERPLAFLNTLTGSNPDTGQKGLLDNIVGKGTVIGDIIGGAADVFGAVSSFPSRAMNSNLAQSLAATYGMSDSTPLPGLLNGEAGNTNLFALPVFGQLAALGDLINGNFMHTVGDLRQHAAGLGWTQQDIEDLAQGKKGIWDFPDKSLHEDPLLNLSATLATDPTNLLFGAGLAGKLPTGLGLMEKFWTATGRAAPAAFDMWRAGRSLATDWHAVTLKGFAEDVGALARGAAYAGRATSLGMKGYKAAAIGTTAFELGVTGLDSAVGDNSPISPYLEPLAEFARRTQNNQPLSGNILFSLASALHFPLHDATQTVRERISAFRANAIGTDVVPDVVRSLARDIDPNAKTLPHAWRVVSDAMPGGETRVYQMIEWAMRDIAADKVNRTVKLLQPNSQLALDYLAAIDETEIQRVTRAMIRKGEFSSQDVLQRIKDMNTGVRNVDALGSGVRFEWDAPRALHNFAEFADRSGEIAQMSDKRTPIVLKVMADYPLPKEHIQALRGSLRAIADLNNGMVPKAQLREMMDQTTRLMRDEPFKTEFAVWGGRNAPALIPFREVDAVMAKAEKTAAPLADYTREAADWEAHQSVTSPNKRPIDPVTGRWNGTQVPVGEARVIATSKLAARARNNVLRATGLSDVWARRGEAQVQAFEHAVPHALDRAAYPVEHVSQSIRYSATRHELVPSVTVDLRPSAHLERDLNEVSVALMEGGSKKLAGQADEVTQILSDRAAESIGKASNAVEYRWNLGTRDPQFASAVTDIMHKAGGLAEYDDTRGVLFLWVRDAELSGDIAEQFAQALSQLVPEDPALGRLRPEESRVLINTIANDRRASNLSLGADNVLSAVRRSVHADLRTSPNRLYAAESYLENARRDAALAPTEGGNGLRPARRASAKSNAGGSPSGELPRSVSESWAAVEDAVAADNGHAIQTAYDNGNAAEGQALNVQEGVDRGGTPESGGAIANGPTGNSINLDALRQSGEPIRTLSPRVVMAVDHFIETLHNEVDPAAIPDALGRVKEAVVARVGEGNPFPPALDEALLRANEDLVSTGGNMGQVLFNAKLDALGDTILPKFDKSLADAPPEVLQQYADYQRRLWSEAPYYTLGKPPTTEVQLRWSNKVGEIIADAPHNQRKWVSALMDRGVFSTPAKFEHMLFSPRRSKVALAEAKQAFYDAHLAHGATVTEVNGYFNTLEYIRNLFEINHVKIFRSADALPRSVYEAVALGKKGSIAVGPFRLAFDPARVGFNGFGEKVLESIGQGNFYKVVDVAASTWWRNISNAAEVGGTRGQAGRLLRAIYPQGMGIRHNVKLWYHVARFLTDPRWWAMNSAEHEIILTTKYGVNVLGAAEHQPGAVNSLLMNARERATGQAEGELALNAAATGWYDTRSSQGQLSRVFDAEAPRSIQRWLDSLPEIDPITGNMVRLLDSADIQGPERAAAIEAAQTGDTFLAAKYGPDKRAWGQMLADDMEKLDLRGAEATVVDEAKRILTEKDYQIMRDSGVLQAVWEHMDSSWQDMKRTLHGNPDRTLMERIANSYWLYWPISYQIKAGKWLYETLTHKLFGNTTNLGGAWYLAEMQDKHEDRMKNDPEYAALFNDHPESWFFAQMFLPITPFDTGISLSRAVKTAGGVAGAWEAPSYSANPFLFAAKLASMGPVFTVEALTRVGQEFQPPKPKKAPSSRGASVAPDLAAYLAR